MTNPRNKRVLFLRDEQASIPIIQLKNIEMEVFIMENYTVLIHAALFLAVCAFWIPAAVCETMGYGLTLKSSISEHVNDCGKLSNTPRTFKYFTYGNGEWNETKIPPFQKGDVTDGSNRTEIN